MSRYFLFNRALIWIAALSLLIAWTTLTVASAEVGAAPSAANKSGVAAIVHPLSASNCSGAVCINVAGSGLNVSDWNTTVRLSKSECTTASFWKNGVKVASGESTCGSSGQTLESDLGYVGNLPNGTELCNTWTGFTGEPCATVHS